jgi:hypothetical protein
MRIRPPNLCRPVYLAAYQSINSTNGGARLFASPGSPPGPSPLARRRHSLLGVTVEAAALSGGERGKPLPPPLLPSPLRVGPAAAAVLVTQAELSH